MAGTFPITVLGRTFYITPSTLARVRGIPLAEANRAAAYAAGGGTRQGNLEAGVASLGLGVGASLLGGELGAESLLAPVLGYAALPLAAYGIYEILSSVLAGRPKMLDTVQAIARLAQSRDPEIQQLARDLAIYSRNGVPLSTSNPQQQAQIRAWIGGAINTILQRQGIAATPQNVGALDVAIRRVLTSETATGGATIDSLIAGLGGAQPQQQATLNLPRRSIGPQFGPSRNQPPATIPPAPPEPIAPGVIPEIARQILARLGASEIETEATACVALGIVNPPAGISCLTLLAAQQIEPTIKSVLNRLIDYFRGQGPTQPAPILDQTSDCPSCTPQGRALLRQQQRLQQDIRTEQQQLTEQQLSQQEQQLSQLEQLEQQPAGQRNIPQELQQKQQLAQQIENELQRAGQPLETAPQPQGGGGPGAAGQPAPILRPSSTELAEHQIEQELQQQHGVQSVQFCVGCKSQEDAILFLNGEPSQCSVIPGTTKEVTH